MKTFKFNIKHALFLAVLLACAAFGASGDKSFPTLEATTLDGKKISIPKSTEGKYTLIGIAYSLKAQTDLSTWVDPVYQSFTNNMFFPVNLYFIPMTGNIKGYSHEKIKEEMKTKLDPVLHKYVLLYQENPDNYINSLGMKEKDKPYFFVLNPRGEIVHTTSGAYSEAKLEAIADKMSE